LIGLLVLQKAAPKFQHRLNMEPCR